MQEQPSVRTVWHGKIHQLLLALVAFLIPFGLNVATPAIILMGVNWLAEGRFSEKFAAIENKKVFWIFCSFYLMHVVGLLYTANMDAGLFDLQVKLSLLLFPLFIGANLHHRTSKSPFLNPTVTFIAGCLIVCLTDLTIVLVRYLDTHQLLLFYSDLSWFMHPSYFAMYLCFAVALLSSHVMSERLKPAHALVAMLLELIFFFMIILLQSKAGIIAIALVFTGLLVKYAILNKKVVASIVCALFLYGMYWTVNRYVVTSNNSRIFNAEYNITEAPVNVKTPETSQVRILIWKACGELLPDYFLLGTGTGDVKDVLCEKYKEKGMDSALELRLNTHDQFLQSELALGLPGLLLLLASFVLPFWISIREKRYIYLFFLVICGFNFLPEAMLETQAGILFYAFFNSLLMFRKNEIEITN